MLTSSVTYSDSRHASSLGGVVARQRALRMGGPSQAEHVAAVRITFGVVPTVLLALLV